MVSPHQWQYYKRWANERSTVKVQNNGQNKYWISLLAMLLKCQQFSNLNMILNGNRSYLTRLYKIRLNSIIILLKKKKTLKWNKCDFYVLVMLMTNSILCSIKYEQIELNEKHFILFISNDETIYCCDNKLTHFKRSGE